jgi:hypothetical protein
MSEQLTTVIALCGPAGSGKSTVADYLVNRYGASRYGFATPLKEMVKRALDFTDEQVYGTQEQKEAVDPRYGHSPRWFLQRIGTEGCRVTFGVDFWSKRALDAIYRHNQSLTVIEDMRFIDEAENVLLDSRVNGFVWRLWPVGDAETVARAASAGNHTSEQEWYALQASLELHPAERGLPHLHALVDEAMKMIPVRSPARGVSW